MSDTVKGPKGELKFLSIDIRHRKKLAVYMTINLVDEEGTVFSCRTAVFEFSLKKLHDVSSCDGDQ